MKSEVKGDQGVTGPAAGTGACLASYVPDPRRYDELLDEHGAVRAHWRTLVERLSADKAHDAARRALEHTRRLIVENGVAYNVYSDPQGADRPWALDPLPLVLSAEEWRQIETGVAQRARVLEALLVDLYGPQRLLAEGLVPPELPFGHPNFLWPCHGLVPRGARWLHVYAADLARAPDGHWRLLADRTQVPSGAGYALENRDIIEQVLPEAMRDLGVRRLRGFFGEMRERLCSLFDQDAHPLVVILTPGPFNETYFEHAYMARQLGLPLVEGQDLTVRDEIVYLKTLGGLKRVHTILRRLDDDYCDPVELRSASALGVPGLVSAIRAHNVVITNALGTGVLESAAWLGFLPGVAERLVGESLQLPAVATWWCGEKPALDYVLANLDHLVVKPSYPTQRFEPVFGSSTAGEERAALVARLQGRPYAYVAQEHVALSQAPVWRTNGTPNFAARAFTIRVYAMATPDGFRVLPGGLARVASESAVDVVSTQRGGSSKDIWVLSHGKDEPVATATRSLAVSIRPDDVPSPSRLVENLFWLGRYTVRCANNARLLRSSVRVRVDRAVWIHAVRICRALGVIAKDSQSSAGLRDDRDPYGIVADVKRIASCASQVRSHLSARAWRAVVRLQRQLQEAAASPQEPREALERIALSLAALSGYAAEDMTHDEGWRLLRIGRGLERLQFTAELLTQHLLAAAATRQGQVEWLLDVCHSIDTYRSRYFGTPRLGSALDLLVRDVHHPAALAFQWGSIEGDLEELAASLKIGRDPGLEAAIPEFADSELLTLEGEGAEGQTARKNLAAKLKALHVAGVQFSDRLSMRHFSHTGDSRSVWT
jgi:uncharacterized circularly permuted ATP-grasp superfamily protein/uncharacterized alpha-E superfamily protein